METIRYQFQVPFLLLGGVNKKEAQEFVIDSHKSYLLRIYISSFTIHFNSFQSISLSNTLPYVQKKYERSFWISTCKHMLS